MNGIYNEVSTFQPIGILVKQNLSIRPFVAIHQVPGEFKKS
jgi:hypothetical protein